MGADVFRQGAVAKAMIKVDQHMSRSTCAGGALRLNAFDRSLNGDSGVNYDCQNGHQRCCRDGTDRTNCPASSAARLSSPPPGSPRRKRSVTISHHNSPTSSTIVAKSGRWPRFEVRLLRIREHNSITAHSANLTITSQSLTINQCSGGSFLCGHIDC